MDAPLVSVVIPTFNLAQYLPAALESVLSQSYGNFEVILVDDGSTDHTEAAIAPYRDRIVYRRQPNAGLAGARNAGMAVARGDFVAWFDADDISVRDRLLVQAAYLASHPAVVAVASDFSAFDDTRGVFDAMHASQYYIPGAGHGLVDLFSEHEYFDGTTVDWLAAPLPSPFTVCRGDVWRRLVLGNFMHPPTLMIRREAIVKAGPLRGGISCAEDWEFITRLAHLGSVAFVNAPLLWYRCHADQMSSSNGIQMALANIRVLEGLLAEHETELADMKTGMLRKLGEFHAAAAYALAETDARQALVHLAHAASLDLRGTRLAWHLARILAPSGLLRLFRSIRRLPEASRDA